MKMQKGYLIFWELRKYLKSRIRKLYRAKYITNLKALLFFEKTGFLFGIIDFLEIPKTLKGIFLS